MSAAPYNVTTIQLTANLPREIRGDTRFAALLSASVDVDTVEISIGSSDSWQPFILGVAVVELVRVDRLAIRSTDTQTVRLATGSAMVYDSRAASGGTVNMDIVSVGGDGLGQKTMAGSIPVVLASDHGAFDVEGSVAAGAAVAAVKPLLMGGSDGTNNRAVRTDANGRPEVVGPVAAGSAIGTHAPVMTGGSDGTNVQRTRLDTSGRTVVVGNTAHDGAVSTDAPILAAGEARSTERAAVASADVARLVTDLYGRLIVAPYTNPENLISGKTAAMTGTADTAVIAAAGASVRNYITGIIVANSHATVGTEVVIKDGTTELCRVYCKALDTVAISFPNPLRGTANTAINAANVTTASNTYVAAVGYKGA